MQISQQIKDHSFIVITIILTIYSQLIIRYVALKLEAPPSDFFNFMQYIFNIFLNPWFISGLLATLFAGLSWMVVMTKFDLGYAYPWTSLIFLMISIISVLFLGEALNIFRFAGTILIVLGLILIVVN